MLHPGSLRSLNISGQWGWKEQRNPTDASYCAYKTVQIMDNAQDINIFIHIVFGTLGILLGIIPYLTKKGGKKHRLFGKAFIVVMCVVIITAINGVIFFRDRPLLTIITLLSSYTTYSGVRVLRTKSNGFSKIDFMVMVIVSSLAIFYILKLKNGNVIWPKPLVYGFSIYILLLTTFDIIRFFVPSLISYPKFWVYEHTYKMTGSFTALISAGASTVFAGHEPYNQLIPAIFCSVLWLVSIVYFPRKFISKSKTKNTLRPT